MTRLQVTNMKFIALICCLALAECLANTDAFVAEATEIISVVKIGVSLVEYIYKVFSNIARDSGAATAISTQIQSKKLLQEYAVVNGALDRLDIGLQSIDAAIGQMNHDMPTAIRRELKLDRVQDIIRRVQNSYETFSFYQSNKDSIEQQTLQDFAQSTVSHLRGSLKSDLNELHSLVVPNKAQISILGSSVVSLMADGIKVLTLQSYPRKMFAVDFQPLWPPRPKKFCGCNNILFNAYKIY